MSPESDKEDKKLSAIPSEKKDKIQSMKPKKCHTCRIKKDF